MIRKLIPYFLYFSLVLSLSAKDKQSVEIILSSDNSIYEQSLYGIQSVLENEVKISYLDIIQSEYGSIEEYFQNLENTRIPMVITIGVQATKSAQEFLRNTPIVFSMVNNPKSLRLDDKNICGVSMDVSVGEYFQTLKDINPEYQKVVGFYSSEDSKFSAEEGNYFDLNYKLLYKSIKVSNDNFSDELKAIQEQTDAFYMISDPIYNQARFEELSKFSQKNGIVLMTSFPTLVKVGATFSISPEYSKIGVETGMMANRILQGESNCQKERVVLPSESAFYLNEEYASESGIRIPEVIVERAKMTKLFSAGITLLNEEKLNPAKKVFDIILKKDPTNKAAQTYQSIVIEKLTGTRTRKLLASAKKFYKAGQYSAARSEYQKVLSINPKNSEAKEGYRDSVQSQSEQERLRATQLARIGKPFDAIRMYLQSLRTLSTNQNTISELANIRRQESAKISGYTKSGIDQYNRRNYKEAIQIFENILLVDPSEKTAKEYLRLSYKKKEAIEKLKKKLGEN